MCTHGAMSKLDPEDHLLMKQLCAKPSARHRVKFTDVEGDSKKIGKGI